MIEITMNVREAIRIGDDVQVILSGINGSQAKLGIIAPRHINIARTELLSPEKRKSIKAKKGLLKRD